MAEVSPHQPIEHFDPPECTCETNEDGKITRISKVQTQNSVMETTDIGFMLESTEDGHFVQDIDSDNMIISCIGLRRGDKLIGINETSVEHYDHEVLLYLLENMFDQTVGHLILTIERITTDDKEKQKLETFELVIDFEILSRGPNDDRRIRITNIRVLTRSNNPLVDRIKFKSEVVCWLRSFHSTGRFLTLGHTGEVEMTVVNDPDDMDAYTFKQYVFHGFRSSGCNETAANEIFICTLQHESSKAYILAKSKTKIGSIRLKSSITTKEKADALFFQIRNLSNGSFVLESVAWRGRYLCWKKGRMILVQYTPDDMMFAETYYNIQFEFCSRKEFNRLNAL